MSGNIVKNGTTVYLKKPIFDDLEYVAKLWADEKTMKDVGGPIQFFDISQRMDWYKRVVDPSDGTHFYCIIYKNDGEPIGEVSFHRFNKDLKTADFNIKIHHLYRGNRYAQEAIKLILEYYFFEFGGEKMVDHIALNNEKGKQALLKFGFEFLSEDEFAYNVIITKKKFESLYGTNNALITNE